MSKVSSGEAVLKTGTLAPYDIVRSLIDYNRWQFKALDENERKAIDTTWNALEDFTNGENALAVIDGSGSMYSRYCSAEPITVAMSLGIYFAEHNKGTFANHFITFSENPQLVELKGESLFEKVKYCETFNEVSKKFHSDKTKGGLKLKNILAGLLVCQNCKKAMCYQAYETKPTVQPRFLHKQSSVCKVKSVLASDVINAVIHSLKLYIEDFELKIDNLPDVDENTIQGQIEALQSEQRKIEKKLAKLFDAWEDEKISDNEFVERKAVNTARIENIQKQMNELEDSIPEKEEYQEIIMRLTDALESLKDETLNADIKNIYLKQIIDKIEFSRENDTEFVLDVYLK
jgi:hypothetical protein